VTCRLFLLKTSSVIVIFYLHFVSCLCCYNCNKYFYFNKKKLRKWNSFGLPRLTATLHPIPTSAFHSWHKNISSQEQSAHSEEIFSPQTFLRPSIICSHHSTRLRFGHKKGKMSVALQCIYQSTYHIYGSEKHNNSVGEKIGCSYSCCCFSLLFIFTPKSNMVAWYGANVYRIDSSAAHNYHTHYNILYGSAQQQQLTCPALPKFSVSVSTIKEIIVSICFSTKWKWTQQFPQTENWSTTQFQTYLKRSCKTVFFCQGHTSQSTSSLPSQSHQQTSTGWINSPNHNVIWQEQSL
jgi:hypothetical protein